ncbi:MAG: DeoR family transcriptional regulator, partial [Chloroflexi bacterium]
IRRDLQRLLAEGKIERTHGGAVAVSNKPVITDPAKNELDGFEKSLSERIDVLIVTAINMYTDELLLNQFSENNKPIIAESLSSGAEATLVAVDNYQAGLDVGRWAGAYAEKHWHGAARFLDLTYHLPNTHERSQGFKDGLQAAIPEAVEVLSINAQSNFNLAYQLTRDALTVHENINMIFAVNDTCADGALKACQDLEIAPEDILVIPFGLEGDTFKNVLAANGYCKMGLAMFPEIVGNMCMQASLRAFGGESLPAHCVTPHMILTPDNLFLFYEQTEAGWEIRWDAVKEHFNLSFVWESDQRIAPLPKRIGFTIRYRAHEWYKNLIAVLKQLAMQQGIEFEVIDIDQTMKNELKLRRNEIARRAVAEVQAGDVILLDSGPIAVALAEGLRRLADVTVITNSTAVLDTLKGVGGITAVSTGGILQPNDPAMVGPIAENTLKNLRADKLFLNVSGITAGFGLSHNNISEVTIKREMIKSAKEIVLLADNQCFRNESFVHFSPVSMVNKLITDEALPASFRLELNKLGVQVIVA